MRDTVDAALSIARFTASDDCAGLADADLLARDPPDLDLWHPWDLPVERAITLAKACEDAGYGMDPRISNSEGATVSTQQSQFIYANSNGFMGGYPGSRHSVTCSVIAGEGDDMQRDDWYTVARAADELEDAEVVGRKAGERVVRRLGARKTGTLEAPVLFEAPVAASLLGHFVSAASGGSLYRKASFLVDSLGEQIFAPLVRIRDLPLLHLVRSPLGVEALSVLERPLKHQALDGADVLGHPLTVDEGRLGQVAKGSKPPVAGRWLQTIALA